MIDFLAGWTNSIGSSIVRMWRELAPLIKSMIAASVVDLPEPVGPVTSTSPERSRLKVFSTGGKFSSSRVLILAGMVRETAPLPGGCFNEFAREAAAGP